MSKCMASFDDEGTGRHRIHICTQKVDPQTGEHEGNHRCTLCHWEWENKGGALRQLKELVKELDEVSHQER